MPNIDLFYCCINIYVCNLGMKYKFEYGYKKTKSIEYEKMCYLGDIHAIYLKGFRALILYEFGYECLSYLGWHQYCGSHEKFLLGTSIVKS